MKTIKSMLALIAGLTLMSASDVMAQDSVQVAVAEDPNEPHTFDGKDFKRLEVAQNGDLVRVSIHTYEDWSFRPFQSLYFRGGEKGQVHVMLLADRFRMLGRAPGRRGVFNVPLAEGRAARSGSEYVLEFSWTAAFGDSPEVKAWLFSQDGRDLLPNTGTLKVQKTPSQADGLPRPAGIPQG